MSGSRGERGPMLRLRDSKIWRSLEKFALVRTLRALGFILADVRRRHFSSHRAVCLLLPPPQLPCPSASL